MIALDLFAGSGWGVACKWLGIHENGVEIMPEAVATRKAAGMKTIYRDVWDGLLDPSMVPDHDLHISSPPCQTFSAAGNGAGRRALSDVLAAIVEGLHEDPRRLFELTERLDPKTALVLTPLAHVFRDRPRFVALEQVPSVLPVWHACAEVMRTWGYSVEVAVLNAEQYGVPQTRRRAILVARNDGLPVSLPTPTHSRYYSTNPTKLDEGVLPWVSMADALGWGMTERPYMTIATGTEGGGTDQAALGGSSARRKVYDERRRGAWSPSGDRDNDTDGGILRLTADDAATVQTYPRRWGFTDRPAVTVGNAVGRGLIGGSGAKKTVADAIEAGTFIPSQGDGSSYAESTRITVEEASVLQSWPRWVHERPAPTIVGTRRSEGGMLVGRQLADNSRRDVGGHQTSVGLHPGQLAAVRVTGDEGAALQSFPTPFPFQGTKTKQFLQIGNAVPPLLAWAILAELTSTPAPLDDWSSVFAETDRMFERSAA